MNLFEHVRVFGTAKGFVGKGFVSPEFKVLNCSVCKKPLSNKKRITCSVECSKQHKKNGKKIVLKSNNFFDFMLKKYGD